MTCCPCQHRRTSAVKPCASTHLSTHPHELRRHGKNLNSDVWRQMQLWKATTENSGHPFAKFATGSYETLMSRPKVRTDPSPWSQRLPCVFWALY